MNLKHKQDTETSKKSSHTPSVAFQKISPFKSAAENIMNIVFTFCGFLTIFFVLIITGFY